MSLKTDSSNESVANWLELNLKLIIFSLRIGPCTVSPPPQYLQKWRTNRVGRGDRLEGDYRALSSSHWLIKPDSASDQHDMRVSDVGDTKSTSTEWSELTGLSTRGRHCATWVYRELSPFDLPQVGAPSPLVKSSRILISQETTRNKNNFISPDIKAQTYVLIYNLYRYNLYLYNLYILYSYTLSISPETPRRGSIYGVIR